MVEVYGGDKDTGIGAYYMEVSEQTKIPTATSILVFLNLLVLPIHLFIFFVLLVYLHFLVSSINFLIDLNVLISRSTSNSKLEAERFISVQPDQVRSRLYQSSITH
jgi:hypothetical protein